MDIYFASGATMSHAEAEPWLIYLPTTTDEGFSKGRSPRLGTSPTLGLRDVSHYLIETLRFLIDVDPAEVFVLVGEVVRKSTVDAYHQESLAADLVVGVVERYLADDDRYVFLENEECRQVLIQMLGTFVGWPEVRQIGISAWRGVSVSRNADEFEAKLSKLLADYSEEEDLAPSVIVSLRIRRRSPLT